MKFSPKRGLHSLFSSPRLHSLEEKLTHRRSFQITFFLGVLGLSVALVILFRLYFNLERFLVYGYFGIFLLTLVSSSTIILPLPGEALLIAAGGVLNPLWLALVASIGGTLGELTGYLAGYWGRKAIAGEYRERYQRAEYWMRRYGGPTIFVFALVPLLIFDLVGLAAGALRFPLWKFLLFCWVGRILRSLAEAYLGWGSFQFFWPVFPPH